MVLEIFGAGIGGALGETAPRRLLTVVRSPFTTAVGTAAEAADELDGLGQSAPDPNTPDRPGMESRESVTDAVPRSPCPEAVG
jgi:hypothetical protein